MKKRLGLVMMIAVSVFAMAQERFLVYQLSSRVTGFGKQFAEERLLFENQDFVDQGRTTNSWRGYLVVDTQGIEAAIIWRTRLFREKRVQVLDLGGGGILASVIKPAPQTDNVIYAMCTARNRGSYPDQESLHLLHLEGGAAVIRDIGSDGNELLSRGLRGQFWFIDSEEESYRMGRLNARLNLRETRAANVLGDRNHDSSVDLDDVIDWYQSGFTNDGWQPIAE